MAPMRRQDKGRAPPPWGSTVTLTARVASALDGVDDFAKDIPDGWAEQEQDGDHNNSY